MPKPEPSTIKLQVFKGREAKLNKAIFNILAQEGLQAIHEIYKRLKAQKGFRYTRYASTLTRRISFDEWTPATW